MSTHCDVAIWLEDEPHFDVGVSESSAWVTCSRRVVIHNLTGDTGLQDLDALEKFFQKGLTAVVLAKVEWMQKHLPGLEPVQ